MKRWDRVGQRGRGKIILGKKIETGAADKVRWVGDQRAEWRSEGGFTDEKETE